MMEVWRERPQDDIARCRALGALFVAGGLLAIASFPLSDRHDGHPWAILAIAASALLSGTPLIVMARPLPNALVKGYMVLGTLCITASVLAGGRHGDIFAFIYVWIAIDSFYFLTPREAVTQLGLLTVAVIGVTLAGALDAAQLLMVLGTCSVGAAFIGGMNWHIRHLLARMAEVARTDWLTGVLNRRGVQEALETAMARSARRPSPLSLLAIDVDNFKALNDAHGHCVGDDALRALGEVLRGVTRATDVAGRVGGEEFSVLLPDTDEHGAYLLAERLRAAVERDQVLGATATTVSVGVATHPQHAVDVDGLTRAADHALYAAKDHGRNRVVLYSATSGDRARHAAADASSEHLAAVFVLAEAQDLRDGDTASHARTVGRYAALIARELGLDAGHIERIRAAGHLHDVGKIGVADPILRKPGSLTPEEWEQMRQHAELGARIVASANLPDISSWVLSHHERPDGTGYPQRLSADEIPLEALILSVADAYEAMTADRVYREALGPDAAREELLRGAGTQFDARVVQAFLRALDAAAPEPTPATAAAPPGPPDPSLAPARR
jgi:diguanylate cyclase (GGDEF)-like protein/putative nucleotidyltransferase with HDIG domain